MKYKAVKRKLAQAYRKASEELQFKDVCRDCLNTKKDDQGLPYPRSWAHKVSRNRCRQLGKYELIWDRRNFDRACRGYSDACHEIRDNGSIGSRLKLNTYLDDLVNWIRLEDPEGYKKVLYDEIQDFDADLFKRLEALIRP